MLSSKRNAQKLVIGLVIAVIGISCSSKSTSDLNIPTAPPSTVNVGAQALEDVSLADIDDTDIPAPTLMTARSKSVDTTLWKKMIMMLDPSRHRGQDDYFPRIAEPLIAARYILGIAPSGVTITPSGTCPPTVGNDCTKTISFPVSGTDITVSVNSVSVSVTLYGSLAVTNHLTSASPLKFTTTLVTTNFKIATGGGYWAQYAGTVVEDYDSTTPSGGFTLTQTSPGSDPMTVTTDTNLQISAQGVRKIEIVPLVSANTTITGATLTVSPPNLSTTAYTLDSTKNITLVSVSPLSVSMSMSRTIINQSNHQTHQRSANLTLTALSLSRVQINGGETFVEPSGSLGVAINNVILDLACTLRPVGGSIGITVDSETLTITFDTSCSCDVSWSLSGGFSGTVDFCESTDSN